MSTGRWLSDSFTPELTHGTQNTLYVFALPEAGIGHAGPLREPVNPAGRSTSVDPALREANAAYTRFAADGVYSAQQASAGQAVYARACAACHGVDFQPAPGTPPLTGGAFMANWRGKSVAELFAYTRGNMPVGQGGSLPDSEYLALIAYLLQQNDFPAGADALDGDEAIMQAIGMGS